MYVSDFLISSGKNAQFEDMSDEVLAENLRLFYGCVRQIPKPGESIGREYSRSGYRNIRAGLQRHLVSPPNNRDINLMSGSAFRMANQVYEGKLKSLKRAGKDQTKHKPAIHEADMARFYDSGVISDTNPLSLLRKVFLEISLHFGRRGREGWRALTKESFSIQRDPNGLEYVTLNYQELDKNHQTTEEKTQCMFATGDVNCPVNSFKKYVNKLNVQCSAFLQRPLQHYEGKDTWYANAPLGVNSIGNMLKDISKESGASKIYTNHSIKASTATILKKAGYQPIDIMSVTGHRNVASLNSYASGPSIEERAKMSNKLAVFGKKNTSEVDTIDILPSSNTVSSAAVPAANSVVSCENTMSSIFAGATFSGNVTINVQICK